MAGVTRVMVGAAIGAAFGIVSVGVPFYCIHRGTYVLTTVDGLLELAAVAYFAGWPLATIGAVAGAADAIIREIRRHNPLPPGPPPR